MRLYFNLYFLYFYSNFLRLVLCISLSWNNSVDQAVLELTEILLSLPPQYWAQRCVLPHLELKDLSVSASQALGLKVCTTTPYVSLSFFFIFNDFNL